DVVLVFALGVVEEVLSVPQLLDVTYLPAGKHLVVLRSTGRVAQRTALLFACTRRAQPQPAAIGALSTHHPFVVGLVGVTVVFRNPVSIAIESLDVAQSIFHGWPSIF